MGNPLYNVSRAAILYLVSNRQRIHRTNQEICRPLRDSELVIKIIHRVGNMITFDLVLLLLSLGYACI